jgi:hypothetical protein
MLTRYEQERILDEQIARMVAEHEQINRTKDFAPADTYCDSRNLTGVPSNANRTYKVAASSWDVHHEIRSDGTLRAVGKVRAVGSDVKVTRADGTTEIRPANSFRRPRETTSRAAVKTQNEQQSRRLALLAKVGNASDYNN